MPTPDFDDGPEDRFEAYLKQFRPLIIESLPSERPSGSTHRSFALAALVAAIVIVISIAVAFGSHHTGRSPRVRGAEPVNAARVERLANAQSLTMQNANALLAAPSLEAAVDAIVVPPPTTPLPEGQHSALAVLGEVRIKP